MLLLHSHHQAAIWLTLQPLQMCLFQLDHLLWLIQALINLATKCLLALVSLLQLSQFSSHRSTVHSQ